MQVRTGGYGTSGPALNEFSSLSRSTIYFRRCSPFDFVVMLVNEAARHRSNDLRLPENIHLIAQAAHRPALNPTEHMWEELREKSLANKALDSLTEVEHSL